MTYGIVKKLYLGEVENTHITFCGKFVYNNGCQVDKIALSCVKDIAERI